MNETTEIMNRKTIVKMILREIFGMTIGLLLICLLILAIHFLVSSITKNTPLRVTKESTLTTAMNLSQNTRKQKIVLMGDSTFFLPEFGKNPDQLRLDAYINKNIKSNAYTLIPAFSAGLMLHHHSLLISQMKIKKGDLVLVCINPRSFSQNWQKAFKQPQNIAQYVFPDARWGGSLYYPRHQINLTVQRWIEFKLQHEFSSTPPGVLIGSSGDSVRFFLQGKKVSQNKVVTARDWRESNGLDLLTKEIALSQYKLEISPEILKSSIIGLQEQTHEKGAWFGIYLTPVNKEKLDELNIYDKLDLKRFERIIKSYAKTNKIPLLDSEKIFPKEAFTDYTEHLYPEYREKLAKQIIEFLPLKNSNN